MTTDRLPHDEYAGQVAAELDALGHAITWWTETPDGEVLDAVFTFDEDLALWPDGVFLGWDQRDGWRLVDKNVRPLDVDTYARPADVAAMTHARLLGQPDPEVSGVDVAGVEDAVIAWEAS